MKNRNIVLVVDERMLKCIQRLLQQHAYGPIMFSSAQAFKSHTCNPLLIMPRYFFDVRDGEGFVKDDEGMELLDIAEAQIEAAETLADMARDLAVRAADPLGHPMAIEVRDGEGRPHFLVGFAFANKRMPEPTLPEPFLEHSFYSNVARRMTL